MKITNDLLQAKNPWNPCESGLAAFNAEYPDGLELSDWTLERQLTLLKTSKVCRLYFGWAVKVGIIPAWSMARVDLSNIDLSGANLSRADLSGADLNMANLSGANLSRADLSDANLIGANLSDANLIGANLIEADLSRANLSGVRLSDANLIGADLSA
jgi:hypothetical protein